MDRRRTLLNLAQHLAEHDKVTHWAISMRLLGKGDFFKRLMDGRDCREPTFRRVMRQFSEQWPDDLSWPADIQRPEIPESMKEAS